ncbi:DUF58 domain-containing protein [Dactylosporangium sp. AC04546]|uniref:DUF58 domain-containing protein n=1 Tax=Dactylosporangium sp. AC04546 TaxID=2862460 RepID=UPI001EE0DD5E|nr:DUF58 domain-containing protein [Dactylosporangium sp. AC04546]WVK83068.1 DUF58 domain-containing protein [Dactylosporangium sp. AC04546]
MADQAAPRSHARAFEPTRALGRAVLVSGVLVLVAVLTGSFDLVVLAAPFAIGTAVSLVRRPGRAPTVAVTAAEPFLVEGGDLDVRVDVGNPNPDGFDLVVVRLLVPQWVRLKHSDRPYAVDVQGGTIAGVDLEGRVLRWGRHPLGPVTAHAVAADGLLISRPVRAPELPLKAYPAIEHFDAAEAMPRAAGHVGGHRSRRTGEGGELAGVRRFGPGDRLRRIDWRVSLRTREIHVVSTLSDRDAEVVVLLDALHEAGRSGGIEGRASVLDTTVRAAAGIAEHYLHRGDRVALLQYGGTVRHLRAASGRRHYMTTLEWLLDVAPAGNADEPPPSSFGPHMVQGNALVMVLTPLLDIRSAAMLANLARAGRFVVAVDTLGNPVLPKRSAAKWGDIPQRLWALERQNIIAQLREHGVPVVAWGGAGSLDEVLRGVARVAVGRTVTA